MSDETFTDARVDVETNVVSNDFETSRGSVIKDDIDYSMPTDMFNIVGVLGNSILGQMYDEGANEDGEVLTDSGIVISTADDKTPKLFLTMEVQMVGKDVEEIKKGDFIVVSSTMGLRTFEFDGRECAMVSEKNVLIKVEPK